MRLFTTALSLLAALPALGHICGPTEIEVEVGDTFTYRIRADVVEEQPTTYGIQDFPDEDIVRVRTSVPFNRKHFGEYTLEAINPGTTTIVFGWYYAPNDAGGPCTLTVTVKPFTPAPETSGDEYSSGYSNDPVNLFLGEFIYDAPTDFDLGGPLPLSFERYYASKLQDAGVGDGILGLNWQHNFDWRLSVGENYATVIRFRGGQARFQKVGGDWVLEDPANANHQLIETSSDVFVYWDSVNQLFYEFNGEGLLAQVRDRNGNTLRVEYDAEGVVPERIYDPFGRELTFAYAGFHHVAMITDGEVAAEYDNVSSQLTAVRIPLDFTASPAMAQTQYNYVSSFGDGVLQLEEIILPEGNTQVALTYVDGRVETETNGVGETWTYSYDELPGDELETTVEAPDGKEIVYLHDANGRLISVERIGDPDRVIDYDSEGNRTEVAHDAETLSSTIYSPTGRPTEVTLPDGQEANASYLTQRDSDGFEFELIERIDYPDGTFAEFEYDANGNMTDLTQRNGGQYEFTFNARGQVETQKLPSGNVITYQYDGMARLESITDASGRTTTYEYAFADRDLISRVIYDGAETFQREFGEYRPSGLIGKFTDESGAVTDITYDENGNTVTVATGTRSETATFDDNDRLKTLTGPGGRVFKRDYDAVGRMIAERITSAVPQRVKTYGYDAGTGLLSSVTDEESRVWGFQYDALSNLSQLADPDSQVTTFEYDDYGRMTLTTTPELRTRSFDYDFLGNLTKTTDGIGRAKLFEYDTRGEVTRITDETSGVELEASRNEMSQLQSVTLPSGLSWQFTYDAQGYPATVASPYHNAVSLNYLRGDLNGITYPDGLGTVSFARNNDGQLTSRTYSDGTVVNYVYDGEGRLNSVTPGVTLSYDGANRINESNGIIVNRSFDTDAIESVQYDGKANVFYATDLTNRVTQITDSTGEGAINLSYDAVGRLTGITRPNGANTNYTYDKDGLMTSFEHTPDLAGAELTFDAANQLVAAERHAPLEYNPESMIDDFPAAFFGDAAAVVDALGRVTSTGGVTLDWNLASQLEQITDSGEPTLTLTHNGYGLLTSISDGTTTREFVWNFAFDEPVISMELINGVETYAYVHLPPGRLLYRINLLTDSREYYHFDEVGHTLFLTDASSSITGRAAYSPYGLRQTAAPEADNVFTYGGMFGVVTLNDRFYQMGVRVYDAATARFLTTDPAMPVLSLVSANPYTYAAGNPMQYVDRTGLVPEEVDTAIGQVSNAGAVNGTADAIGNVLRPVLEKSFETAKAGINPQNADTTADAVRALRRVDRLETAMEFTSGDPPTKLGKAGNALNKAGAAAQIYGLYNDAVKASAAADETLSSYERLLGAALQQYDIELRVLKEAYEKKLINIDQWAIRSKLAYLRFEKRLYDLEQGYWTELQLDLYSFAANGLGGFLPFYGEVRDATGFIPE